MSLSSLYPVVAGVSLVLAMWQPADADRSSAAQPAERAAPSNQLDRASNRIDERIARHKARWQDRKARVKQGDGS